MTLSIRHSVSQKFNIMAFRLMTDTLHDEIQNNNIQHNDTQPFSITLPSTLTFSIITLGILTLTTKTLCITTLIIISCNTQQNKLTIIASLIQLLGVAVLPVVLPNVPAPFNNHVYILKFFSRNCFRFKYHI